MRRTRRSPSNKPTPTNVAKIFNRVSDVFDVCADRMRDAIMPTDIDQWALMEMVVPEDQQDIVRRSKSIWQFSLSGWQEPTMRVMIGERKMFLRFDSDYLAWLPPSALDCTKPWDEMSDSFKSYFGPFLDEATTIADMKQTANEAWNELHALCWVGGTADIRLVRFFWPTIDIVAKERGVDLSSVKPPVAVPSMPPALREKLETATALINSAQMMPQRDVRNLPIKVSLG